MTFRKVIAGDKTVHSNSTEVDTKTNRNSKMVQTLLRPDINGVFLYFTEKNGEKIGDGLMLPPGLDKEEMYMFKMEFLMLLEKYAKKANK